ncbi:transketolase-like protein [Trichococcus patagoniensis]|uniref:1-deoxy-D-xylulose-5-phosphate synthase n=1 Tax=Trichococcus patagoniensis TaxID=382641 RepID=A0A2T5IQU1_9LACT|nr:transketolase C-terminal domain-containing protein [Trichococcus patagoniensis]PTQ86186.1 transketolase-like protein [Trichococcus patagoniensis]
MFRLNVFKAAHPEHFFDVGIAEGHSITFAAGLASQGVKPVVFHSMTFLQRAYDQLSQDLAINELLAVLIIGGGNISSGAMTHLGLFDIPLIKSIPNFNYLAPTSKEELLAMLDWALQQEKGPIAIRLPNGPAVSRENKMADFQSPTYEILHKGKRVALLALGSFLSLGEQVTDQMKVETGEDITLVNPRSIREVDADTLKDLEATPDLIATLEDGSLAGRIL